MAARSVETDLVTIPIAFSKTLINRIPEQLNFHRFNDLPIELRYEVYTQYFVDEQTALCCRLWPFSYLANYGVMSEIYDHSIPKKLTPFLPNLCLASRALGQEATSLLFADAAVAICGEAAFPYFLKKSNTATGTDLARMIHKLMLLDVNNCKRDFGFQASNDTHHVQYRSQTSNHLHSQLLAQCKQLKELYVRFEAPLVWCKDSYGRQHGRYRFLSIEEVMEGFSVDTILKMKDLRKVCFAVLLKTTRWSDEDVTSKDLLAYDHSNRQAALNLKSSIAKHSSDCEFLLETWVDGIPKEESL